MPTINMEVDIAQLGESVSQSLNHEAAIDLIQEIDEAYGDWNFTIKLFEGLVDEIGRDSDTMKAVVIPEVKNRILMKLDGVIEALNE